MPRSVKSVISFLFFLAYPFAVYLCLKEYGARTASLLVLLLLLPGLYRRYKAYRQGGIAVLVQAAGILILVSLSALLDQEILLKQVPVLISVFLASSFSWTLFRPPSMVERYAKLMAADLTEQEMKYCKRLTVAWIVFFIVNAGFIEYLAVEMDIGAWTLYVGFIGYIVIGALMSVELVFRRIKFKRFGIPFMDRLESRLFGKG